MTRNYSLDSNLIIFGSKPGDRTIRQFIKNRVPIVSAVSKVETLGYHALGSTERQHLERFFSAAVELPVSKDVIERAIRLRQRRPMKLGDALIAATALAADLVLATRNVADFRSIDGLQVVDPYSGTE